MLATAVSYAGSAGSAVSVSTPAREPVKENLASVAPAGIVTEAGAATAPELACSSMLKGLGAGASSETSAVALPPSSTPAAGYDDRWIARFKVVSAAARSE